MKEDARPRPGPSVGADSTVLWLRRVLGPGQPRAGLLDGLEAGPLGHQPRAVGSVQHLDPTLGAGLNRALDPIPALQRRLVGVDERGGPGPVEHRVRRGARAVGLAHGVVAARWTSEKPEGCHTARPARSSARAVTRLVVKSFWSLSESLTLTASRMNRRAQVPNAPTRAWPWASAVEGTAGSPHIVSGVVPKAPPESSRSPLPVEVALSMFAQSTGLTATASGCASDSS